MTNTKTIELILASKEVEDLVNQGHTWGIREQLKKLLSQAWMAGFAEGLDFEEDKHDGR